jgi:thioredoxin reductase
MIYDLAIIGGGPAGAAAAVYASRKKLKTVIITETFGGQSSVSEDIENWIGTISVSGTDLAKMLEEHVEAYAEDIVDIQKGERAESVIKNDDGTFTVTTGQGNNVKTYQSKTVLVTTGSKRRQLEVPGAAEFENRGLMYCASCDGPLFTGKEVAVIGGGNSALEGVLQLANYCTKVYLIHRRDEFRADPITVDAARNNDKVEFITNAEVTEILGDKMLTGLKYKKVDGADGGADGGTDDAEEIELSLGGAFVEIGAIPAVGPLSDLDGLKMSNNTIEVDPWSQRTSIDGLWAAGDVTNVKYHQNNIAAGDAVKALEDIYVWIKERE